MGKIAYVFPGQGAQYVGMAKDFYDQYAESKEIFNIAKEALDFDIEKVCFEENTDINKTEYTQAAILTATIAILKVVETFGLKPDYTAGLSLGEFSALVANKTLSFEDAVKMVRKRGCFMESEVPAGKGTMAAVIGLEGEIVEKICEEVTKENGNAVEPANYNCPGQIVISGETSAVLEAKEKLEEVGARSVKLLNVSGPFHSVLLEGVEEKLHKELQNVKFQKATIPYVSSVIPEVIQPSDDSTYIKTLLEKQVHVSVKWQQAVEKLIEEGVDTFIEIGPGKTLSSFIKRISRKVKILKVEKVEELANIKKLIEQAD